MQEHKKPKWAYRANNIEYKPDWEDKIPHQLWSLGKVFFPIPRAVKGHDYPHHLEEYRYKAKSEILNAYLEAGSGYGICCAGDLAVVDIDEKSYVNYVSEVLSETIWQITGSRNGYHLFYFIPELNTRINLIVKIPNNHVYAEGYEKTNYSRHIGEVKCDPHGYVIGPGSVHPSGNTYGPLKGDKIKEISKETLEDSLNVFITNHSDVYHSKRNKIETAKKNINSKTKYNFYKLDANDVVPWLEPNKRVPHPGHGSNSGKNFMKNEDGETFTCWRHNYGGSQGCGLNPQQLLAQIETNKDCDVIRGNWPIKDDEQQKWYGDLELLWYSWKKAVEKGLVSAKEIPYKIVKSYSYSQGYTDENETIYGKEFWDTKNEIKCVVTEKYTIQSKPN